MKKFYFLFGTLLLILCADLIIEDFKSIFLLTEIELVCCLLGLISIVCEFYLPGGIMAIIGTILILAGFTISFIQNGANVTIILIVLVMIALFVLIKLTLSDLTKSSIRLNNDQKGFTSVKTEKRFIGEVGTAVTDMSPSGRISILERNLQARSTSGFIEKGDLVKVVSVDMGTYIVIKYNQGDKI